MSYEIKLDWNKDLTSHYFIIVNYTNKTLYDTSVMISDLLDIDLGEYNKRLVKEVIKTDQYTICAKGRRLYKDLTFEATEESEIYIERFKEVFVKELTILFFLSFLFTSHLFYGIINL